MLLALFIKKVWTSRIGEDTDVIMRSGLSIVPGLRTGARLKKTKHTQHDDKLSRINPLINIDLSSAAILSKSGLHYFEFSRNRTACQWLGWASSASIHQYWPSTS
jgi:hypothetical protein